MDEGLRARLRAAYDAKAAERDAAEIAPWKLEIRSDFLSLLQAEGKRRLLELGAGPGRDALFFQVHGLEVVCVDLSPEMVTHCRAKGLEAHVMDMTQLSFPAGSFDGVYALNALLHLPRGEMPTVLRDIKRVLRPEGLLYLGLHGGRAYEGIYPEDGYEPKRFYCLYRDDQLLEIVGQTFEIVSFKTIRTGGKGSDLHFQSMVARRSSKSHPLKSG